MEGKKKILLKRREKIDFFTHLLVDEVDETKKGFSFETLYSSPRQKADKVSLLRISFTGTRQRKPRDFLQGQKRKEVLKKMSSI